MKFNVSGDTDSIFFKSAAFASTLLSDRLAIALERFACFLAIRREAESFVSFSRSRAHVATFFDACLICLIGRL